MSKIVIEAATRLMADLEHNVASGLVERLTKTIGNFSKKTKLKTGDPQDGMLRWDNVKFKGESIKQLVLRTADGVLLLAIRSDERGEGQTELSDYNLSSMKEALRAVVQGISYDASPYLASLVSEILGGKPLPMPKVSTQSVDSFGEELGDDYRAVYESLPRPVKTKIAQHRVFQNTRYKYAFEDFLQEPKKFGYTGKIKL